MKRKYIIILSIVGLLVIIRLILPFIVLKVLNNKLANLAEYHGHIEDIDLHLYRGAYEIKDINIYKVDKETREIIEKIPFYTCPEIDLSIDWRALFKGKVVGKVHMEAPKIHFVNGAHKDEDIKQDTTDLKDVSKAVMPLTANVFTINNGEFHFIDPKVKPQINLNIKDINVRATNISNVNDSNTLLPANLVATGNAYKGRFNLKVNYSIFHKYPTFDLQAEMKDIHLVMLNDMLKTYGDFNVTEGKVGMFAEFAAKDGKFGGYVKPFISDLKVGHYNEEGEKRKTFWEKMLGIGAKVVTNPRTESIATQVKINGSFEDPGINQWRAISLLIRNAFVKALQPAIENSISVSNMEGNDKKTLLERVFGDGSKKSDKEKKGKKD